MGQRARITDLNLARARQMRREPTPAERLLWERLRNRKLHGLKFRQQYPFDGYILDFYCAESKIVVELDGESHNDKSNYDRDRTIWLEVNEMEVLRFPNNRVIEEMELVLNEIHQRCVSRCKRKDAL